MSKQSLHFRCPACNRHSNIESLKEELKPFAIFERTIGGKVAAPEYEKILMKGMPTGKQGSAHGKIGYHEQPYFTRDLYIDQMIERLELALSKLRAIRSQAK
jgi:hypothetical protein